MAGSLHETHDRVVHGLVLYSRTELLFWSVQGRYVVIVAFATMGSAVIGGRTCAADLVSYKSKR